MSDGRIIIDTAIDSSGAEKGLSKFSGKLGGIAKTGLKAITTGIGAVGTAITGLGAIAVKNGSDIENYMANFETMLGSTSKAQEHLNELKEFAAKTPFELNDLANASKTLLAFGANVEDVTPDLKMLGDISLGNKEKFNSLALVFGQVQSQGKLMGQDLLQMINAGFNPLLVISQKTGKSMSELKEEMADGKISFEMVADAMKTATSEGGQFYNAMDKSSQTLSGMLSTLKDNAKALVTEVFQPVSDGLKNTVMPTVSGYIDTLSNAFKSQGVEGLVNTFGDIFADIVTNIASYAPKIIDVAVNVIDSFIDGLLSNEDAIWDAATNIISSLANGIIKIAPKLAELGTDLISKLVSSILEKLPEIIEAGADLAKGLINGIEKALPGLSIILDPIKELFNFITENKEAVSAALVAIGAGFAAFKIGKTIMTCVGALKKFKEATTLAGIAQKAFNLIMEANPIILVISLIAGLIAGIVYLWNTNEDFRNFIIGCWNKIKEVALSVWGGICDFFTKDIPEAWNALLEFFSSAGEWAAELWGKIKQGFVDGWNSIVAFFTETIPQWIEDMGNWFNQLPDKIAYALGYALGTIIKWGRDTWNNFTETCTNIYNTVTEWFSQLPSKIREFITDAYNKVVEWGTNTWNKFIETCTNVFNSVVEWFSKLPGMIWDWLKQAIDKVVQWGQETYWKMVEAVSNAVNAVIEWFASLPGKIWEWLLDTIARVGEFASDLGSKALEAGKDFCDNLIDAVVDLPSKFMDIGKHIVTGVWDGICGMANWIKKKVSGFFKNIVKGAREAMDINSPSRVFRDQVGKYMAQGVGVGFDDETQKVKDSIDENLRNMVSKLDIGALNAKMTAAVSYETAKTGVGLVAGTVNNRYITNSTIYNDSGLDKVIKAVEGIARRPIENHIAIDGREAVRATAPYQGEWLNYNKGR